jgi:DNA polymerase-4
LKFFDFEMITRSRSVQAPVSTRDDLERLVVDLLRVEMPLPKPIRLLGVSLSALQTEADGEPQLMLPI